MERLDIKRSNIYLDAKKKVEELKGFYIHALVYVIINLFITISKVIRNLYYEESFNQSFFEFETFVVWIFWGVGLLIHGMNVFRFNLIFGKRWQERKLKQYLEEDAF